MAGAISAGSFISWLAFHVVSWLMQWAWTALRGGSWGCDVPLCGTPLAGVGSIMKREPDFSIAFIGGVLGDVGAIVWGIWTVQWEIYRGDDLIWAVTTIAGAATAVSALIFFVINIRR